MKYCTKCGTKQDDDATYCMSCGMKLSSNAEMKSVSITTGSRTEVAQTYRNTYKAANPISVYVLRCISCGREYTTYYKNCPDCGTLLGAPVKSNSNIGVTNINSLTSRSIYSAKNSVLHTALIIISVLGMIFGLFAPIVDVGYGLGSTRFIDILSSIDTAGFGILGSSLTWIGIFTVVPAVFLLVGVIKKEKNKCIVSMAVSLVGLLAVMLVLVDSLESKSLHLEYLVGENGLLAAGFYGPVIGNVIGLVCSICLDD